MCMACEHQRRMQHKWFGILRPHAFVVHPVNICSNHWAGHAGWHQSLSSHVCGGYAKLHFFNACFIHHCHSTSRWRSAWLRPMSARWYMSVQRWLGNSHACDSFKSILSIMAVLSTWTTKNSLYMTMQHFKVMTLVRALLYLSTKTRGDWVRGLASRQQRNKW